MRPGSSNEVVEAGVPSIEKGELDVSLEAIEWVHRRIIGKEMPTVSD